MAKRGPIARSFMRWVMYPLQAGIILAAYWVARAMPIEWASAAGGYLFRTIGSRMRVDRTARKNLERAFPEKSPAEIDQIVRGMWDNLGRGAGEFAQLDRIDTLDSEGRVEFTGVEHIERLRDDGEPGIVFSGHLGNWELDCLASAQLGLPLGQIYRKADNPYMNKLFFKMRGCIGGELIPKGRAGAGLAVRHMRDGGHLGLLIDQKMNEGIPVPFFGRDAWTATAPADLALKFKAPVVPARIVRLPGARFKIEVFPPMELPDTGDRKADVRTLITQMTALIEGWIRDNPEQWFWVHRRWPNE